MTSAVPPELARARRTAWIPRVREGDDEPAASKLGGTPWIPTGQQHPVCPICNKPMPLLAQLDVATLPEPARFGGDGLIQLFYCTNSEPTCEIEAEAFVPYAKSVVARRIDARSPGGPSTAVVEQPFIAKRIVAWDARDDYPNPDEIRVLGIEVDDRYQLEDDYPLSGEKLGGWPYWVQSLEYPTCQECKESMELVLQIDSYGLLDYQWGDAGCAHLTQCPRHPDRLAFAWAGA